jgi:hypothetical protein
MAKVWKIRGLDGLQVVFERAIPQNSLSDAEAIVMLQRLQARHLNDGEIVSASLRQGAAGYRHDFEVQRNQGGSYGFMTTSTGRYYSATIEEAEDAARS